jgi:uncharacterized membrane protein YkvA (DUF1232 family)
MMLKSWKQRARQLKRLLSALYVAYRDPRTPVVAKVVALCVVAYAVSPIDLIPDPIPVLGYLDDAILLPLGIALAIRLLPREVWDDARAAAPVTIPVNRIAGAVIVLIWVALAVAGVVLVRRWW